MNRIIYTLFSACLLLLSHAAFAQVISPANCGATPGVLDCTVTSLCEGDSTAVPTYTTSPVGLPNTEFAITLPDSAAADGYGDAIVAIDIDGQIDPAAYGIAPGDSFCVTPISYNLVQIQAMIDSIFNGTFFMTPCCNIVDLALPGLCTDLQAAGITQGSDIQDMNDVLTLVLTFGSASSVSIDGFILEVDSINMNAASLPADCGGNQLPICYAAESGTPCCYYVEPAPDATVTTSGPTTFCTGDDVTLTVPAGASSYTWYGNGMMLSITGNSLTTDTSGSYYVVIESASACMSMSDTVDVTVNAGITVNLMPTGSLTLCTGESTTLSATAGAGQYTWLLDGTPLANQPGGNQLSVLNTGGDYSVVGASGICTDTSNVVSISIDPTPLPIPIVMSTGDNPFCPGDTLNLAADQNADEYQWYRDNVAIPGATMSTYDVTMEGEYYVVVTNGTSCSVTSSATQIDTFLTVTPTITENQGILIAPSAVAYQWYQDGVAIIGETTVTYEPTSSGMYSVEIEDGNGCLLLSDPYNYIMISVPELASVGVISIYPNPFQDAVSLELERTNAATTLTIDVLTVATGQVVEQFSFNAQSQIKTNLSLEALPAGMYFLRITDGKETVVEKIVKQ